MLLGGVAGGTALLQLLCSTALYVRKMPAGRAATVTHTRVRVAHNQRISLVTLAIEWEDPALAAKWANNLVRHVNGRLRAEAVEEAERSIAYLERQLPQTTSVEVQQAIYRLIEAQTKKKMIASTREEYAFTTIDPAVTPERRQRPRRTLLVVLGLILGMAGGCVVAVVMKRRTELDHGQR